MCLVGRIKTAKVTEIDSSSLCLDVDGRPIKVGADVVVLHDADGHQVADPIPAWVLAVQGALATLAVQGGDGGMTELPGDHLRLRQVEVGASVSRRDLGALLAAGKVPTSEAGDGWFGVRRRAPQQRLPVLGASHTPPAEKVAGESDEVVHLVRVPLPLREIPPSLSTACGLLTVTPGDAELVPIMAAGMPCWACLSASGWVDPSFPR